MCLGGRLRCAFRRYDHQESRPTAEVGYWRESMARPSSGERARSSTWRAA
jgi:hypothetical protein